MGLSTYFYLVLIFRKRGTNATHEVLILRLFVFQSTWAHI